MRRIALPLAVAAVTGGLALVPSGGAAAGSAKLAGLAPALNGRVALTTLAPSVNGTNPDAGAAPLTDKIIAMVGLQYHDLAGLKRTVAEVSDPSSAHYAHYLTPAQVRAKYAPTQATADTVVAWLKAAGLKTYVPKNRAFVYVSGTVAQADLAFGTTMRRVLTSKFGLVDAPTVQASAPLALRGLVTQIRGLDGGDQVHTDSYFAPPASVVTPPCTHTYHETVRPDTPGGYYEVTCGYEPKQMEDAYGITPVLKAGIDGKGVTVAVIDPLASPRMQDDVNTYSDKHGLPHATYIDNSDPVATAAPTLPGGLVDPDDDESEQTLDVEAIHSMAPGATIYYQAADTLLSVNLELAQNEVVTSNAASIISNSYGGASDSSDSTADGTFMQGAAQGQGFLFSSGDQGDESLDPNGPGDRETDNFANSPYVTAVGGTAIGIDAQGRRMFETYWGNFTKTLTNGMFVDSNGKADGKGDFYAGGGGGTSQAYAEPDYQKAVVPDSLASYWKGKPAESQASDAISPGRVEPDIAMLGDPNTGMLMGQTMDFTSHGNPNGQQLPTDDVHYGEFRIGGTSLSSPLMAGVLALAQQASGKSLGFATPALYAAYGKDKTGFIDPQHLNPAQYIVRTNNTNGIDATDGTTTALRNLDQTVTLHDLTGYDDATGLGVPRGAAFLALLAPGNSTLAGLVSSAPPLSGTVETPATTKPAASATSKCVAGTKLTFSIKPSGKKVRTTAVRVYLNGKAKVSRKGKKLTSVTVKRPAGVKLTVKIVTTRSNRTQVTSTRTYSGCTRTKVSTKTKHLKS